jgi:glyoxylase-like metal-dependent hydrolase (beta-lactamase superfamily II)/ferredoxin
MADPSRILEQNVSGDFYVDNTCIDCDTCRQIAPEVFRDQGGQSSVYNQPRDRDEIDRTLMALVSCPTASIGSRSRQKIQPALDSLPLLIEDDVYFCGFTSKESFGAWSYLIVRPKHRGGNILVDSPRYSSHLVRRFEEAGGIDSIFLTHSDDVADQDRYAARFNSRRVMHKDDGAQSLGVEMIIDGTDAVRLDDELTVIPVPGHTRGSQLLLYRDKFLFTGDHLAWSERLEHLVAYRSVAWYSWKEQTHSMEKLTSYSFEWVLPGHGPIHKDSPERMQQHLWKCIDWMKHR